MTPERPLEVKCGFTAWEDNGLFYASFLGITHESDESTDEAVEAVWEVINDLCNTWHE